MVGLLDQNIVSVDVIAEVHHVLEDLQGVFHAFRDADFAAQSFDGGMGLQDNVHAVGFLEPYKYLLLALVTYNLSLALVMATYINLRSSSNSFSPS